MISNTVLQGINVNSSSGDKIGREKFFAYLESLTSKELTSVRMKAVDYSNAPIVSTIDISRHSNNKELSSYPQRNLASMTSMQESRTVEN